MNYLNGLLSEERTTGGNAMKKILIVIFILVLLAILYPMLYAPCTPRSERAMCKKEIGCLRGYLLDNDFYGISFFPIKFSHRPSEIAYRVGEYCEEVNQIARNRMEKDVFRVVPSSEGKRFVVIDRWGTPYNFCSVEERQRNRWDNLEYAEISNIVIWSSGPNKVNEYGANDDVTLRIRPHFQAENKDE